MNDDAIYLLTGDGRLERVPKRDYATEELLQSLVERYPELLAGEQINAERPVRWLLVRREAGIPSEEVGSDRWSVDHLLLDQDGIPTFVEVKRSSDTRIRREVVGQMLDYAANARKYWPEDRIRSLAAVQYEDHGGIDDAIAVLLELASAPTEAEEIESYWTSVAENLRAGRVRLLFVADELPAELRRVIEFLNEHMNTVEVLGVELRQYAAAGVQALVPRIVGQTESTREAKRKAPSRPAPMDFDTLASLVEPEVAKFFARTVSRAKREGLIVKWNATGFALRIPHAEGAWSVVQAAPAGGRFNRPAANLEGYVGYLPEGRLRELATEKLRRVPGAEPTTSGLTYWVTLPPDDLSSGEAMVDAVVEVARRAKSEAQDAAHSADTRA